MSAKSAADALYEFDTCLKDSIDKLNNTGSYWWITEDGSKAAVQIVRDAAGSWTLSMVAKAAGVSEEMVLTALYKNYLKGGTQMAASGRVYRILRDCF